MGDEGAMVTGIRQIVRLRELLQKWQSMTLGPKAAAGEERPKSVCLHCESDEEYCCCCQSPDAPPDVPPDVPRGYCPVYVGLEQRRFVIPTSYLSLPVFRLLLEKAEEEFGFDHKGALTIPCETESFKYILQCMERHAKGLIDDEGNPTGMEERMCQLQHSKG